MFALYFSFQAPKIIQKFLSETGGEEATVVVSVPTRKAATSIARRVSEELGTPIGGKVGFSIGGLSEKSVKTNILYVTPGLLLNVVKKHGKNINFNCIILDEIHIITPEMELLLALLRSITNSGVKLKLVIRVCQLKIIPIPCAMFLVFMGVLLIQKKLQNSPFEGFSATCKQFLILV